MEKLFNAEDCWELSKTFTFEASHKLPFHQGKCSRLHGHSWRLKVTVHGNKLCQPITSHSSVDMLMDYAHLKDWVAPLIDDYLDHWHLNDSLELDNPTSEKVAAFVYWWLYKRRTSLPDGVRLKSVTIYETCTSECTFSKVGGYWSQEKK